MFDFDDVVASSKDEQIRAYALERALEAASVDPARYTNVISLAAKMEKYIKSGEETDGTQA